METASVIIHARFAPNGTVVEISERPQGVGMQEWFFFLSDNAPNAYQAFSGGRGVFKLTKAELESLKAGAAASAA